MYNQIGLVCIKAYTSVNKGSLSLKDHKDLAKHLNTIVFHTKMVDSLDEILTETSDLSVYWYVLTLNLTFWMRS